MAVFAKKVIYRSDILFRYMIYAKTFFAKNHFPVTKQSLSPSFPGVPENKFCGYILLLADYFLSRNVKKQPIGKKFAYNRRVRINLRH